MIAWAMLSAETVARLDRLCDDSRYVFPEGGVVYTFTDSAGQDQTRISRALARLRDLGHNAHATNATLKAEFDVRAAALKNADLTAFSRFLFSARGHANMPNAAAALEEASEEA